MALLLNRICLTIHIINQQTHAYKVYNLLIYIQIFIYLCTLLTTHTYTIHTYINVSPLQHTIGTITSRTEHTLCSNQFLQ